MKEGEKLTELNRYIGSDGKRGKPINLAAGRVKRPLQS